MSNLGSFGAAVREADPNAEKDTFDFCGETFTVYGAIPPVLMLQLGAAVTGKIDEAEGFAAIWEAMRRSLLDGDDPKEFDRFYRVAVDKHVELEELIRLAMKLFEVQAGRPTKEPQGSSAGQSTTSPSSNGSSSPSHRLVAVDQLMAG